MFSLNSFCLSFCFPLFLKTQFPFFSSLIYNIWVTIFALIHNSFMTKSCQQETRIKGLAFLNLVNSEYFLFLSPKKTQAFTLFIFQGHQNISSGIIDSYEYHILSKNDDYFFSKNHFGLFVYCIFWPSSKSLSVPFLQKEQLIIELLFALLNLSATQVWVQQHISIQPSDLGFREVFLESFFYTYIKKLGQIYVPWGLGRQK